MSIHALEVLRDLELLDKHDRVTDLSKLDQEVIQRKLREYESSGQADIERITNTHDLGAVISSISASNTVIPLLPSCFVYNRVYTNDPLLKIARTPDHMTTVQMRSLGMNPNININIASLHNKLKYFEMLAPLIRLGCITVLPLYSLHRRKSEGPVPIYYSEDWFRSEVPDQIHNFVHERAVIKEVRPGSNGKGIEVLDRYPDSPTRGIAVQFSGDESVTGLSFYNLYEQRLIEKAEDGDHRFAQILDWDNPPSEEHFKAWVYQSVNRTIIDRINCISREMIIANHLNASYLTESEFEARLCGLSYENTKSDDLYTSSVNFLTANAPYLRLDNPALLAKFRSEKAEEFERWQQSLLYVTRELNGIQDNFEAKSKALFEGEIRPQIEEMKKELLSMSSGVGGGVLVTAGTIAMALLASPSLPLASVLGLGVVIFSGMSLPSVSQYLSNHSGPAYIWKKLTAK